MSNHPNIKKHKPKPTSTHTSCPPSPHLSSGTLGSCSPSPAPHYSLPELEVETRVAKTSSLLNRMAQILSTNHHTASHAASPIVHTLNTLYSFPPPIRIRIALTYTSAFIDAFSQPDRPQPANLPILSFFLNLLLCGPQSKGITFPLDTLLSIVNNLIPILSDPKNSSDSEFYYLQSYNFSSFLINPLKLKPTEFPMSKLRLQCITTKRLVW